MWTRLNDGSRGLPIARVLDKRPEHQANARLIEAAPELLDALEDALAWMSERKDRRGDDFTGLAEAKAKARAALKKAAGAS